MNLRSIVAGAIALVLCAAAGSAQTPPKKKELTTKATRLAFIRQAQVWTPTQVADMDLRAGPQGAGAFEPNEAVECDYLKEADRHHEKV
jgi:hypothetical protein